LLTGADRPGALEAFEEMLGALSPGSLIGDELSLVGWEGPVSAGRGRKSAPGDPAAA